MPALLALLASFAGAVAACGGGDRPSAGGDSTSSGGSGGGGSGGGDGGASGDATSDAAIAPALCVPREAGATVIEEISLGSAAPAPLGGPITNGSYDLSEAYVYAAPVDGGTIEPGRSLASSIFVTSNSIEVIDAVGDDAGALGAASVYAYLYAPKDATILATQACPTTGATTPLGYSAVGDSFAFYPDSAHRRVYLLRQ